MRSRDHPDGLRMGWTCQVISLSAVQVEDTPLSLPKELKPNAKQRIMDLVSAAGIDVSDWANFARGKKKAASNPKYCYEWSFVGPGRIVINLWHSRLKERKGIVFVELNLRERDPESSQRGREGARKARAEKFDRAIQEAAKNSLPIRVVVMDGQMRDNDALDSKASRVEYRLLDPVPWAVAEYDWKTGDCTLRRGALTGKFVDQFIAIPEAEVEVERRMVSGMAYVRNPAIRHRALERAKGACEYCEEPGFSMVDGSIFLETHHVVPLSEGGPDTEDNVAAICPNHHREAHHGTRAAEIRQTLIRRLRHRSRKSR